MERYGILFLSVSVIIIIALIAALLVILYSKLEKRPEDKVCNTLDCVETAARFLRSIDESVDPCNDFYEFACGTFLREAIIPDDKSSTGPLDDLTDLAERQLRKIFEETYSPDELKPFALVKNFYKMCLDKDKLEDFTSIKKLIKDLGGWPVLEGNSWGEKGFDWQNFVLKFRKKGLSISNYIKIVISAGMENSSQSVIYLDQVEFDIDRDTLLSGMENKIVKAYYDYMVDMAVYFGANRIFAEYDMKDILDFNIQLANISLSEAEHREQLSSCHTMTVLELQRRYPPIYWFEYLNKIINLPDKSISNDQKVAVISPKYISKIGYLLEKTSKRVLANYAIFQALSSLELYLPEAMRDRAQQFSAVAYGVIKRQPRWQDCVEETTYSFEIAAGALYVRKYFKEETKKNAAEIIQDIQNAFVKILEEANWMDESTRENAIEKTLAINSHVAYPDEFLDDLKLLDYYAELNSDFDNILEFTSKVSVFRKNKEMSLLGELINKTDWRTRYSSIDVNAVYEPVENSIQLPAAILQSFLFNKDRLRSVNYANVGFFIGHEITHGFDDQGRKYDKDGNLLTWWPPEIVEAFTKRAECIIDQYSNYTIPKINKHLNGKLTQGENIADNGGIKEAYIAYSAWVERNAPEPRLPGLNYTGKQLFWISAAYSWCSKERKEALLSQLTDVHSPARFRILGSFSNSDDFVSDFQCPEGSKMNPKRKCNVW